MSPLRIAVVAVFSVTFAAAGGCTGQITGGDGDGNVNGNGGGDGDGCKVQALVQSRCVSCHAASPINGAPMSLASLDALRLPSQKETSQSVAQRCVERMKSTDNPMPPAGGTPATADEIAVVSSWIDAGMPACSEGGEEQYSPPNLLPQNELFTCKDAVSDAPTRIRRVNRWQWTRNVGGAVTRGWTGFTFFDNPFDPGASEAYSTYATDDTLDEATIELFLPVLNEAGPQWAGPYTGGNRLERLRLDATLRCMWDDDRPDAACVQHYLHEFLLHGVLFREPSDGELNRLQQFATTILAAEPPASGGTDTRTHSITRISNAAWMTAGALFRTEGGDPAATGRTQLTSWELGQQLAYAVGSRAPGATPTWVYPDFSAPLEGHLADIAAAAANGTIRNPATAEALFLQNVGGTDPSRFDLIQDYNENERAARGQYWLGDGATGFFREWLGYSKIPEIFKERPEALSAFDDGDPSGYRAQLSSYSNLMDGYYGDESTLVQQMEDLVARVVVEDQDVLKNLLTTRRYYLASTTQPTPAPSATEHTGQIYNVTQPVDTNRWVTVPANERAGVLTHPAWLGSHGGNFEDDPSAVHRGKWVRENLLCGYVPPLSSVRVMAKVGPHAPNKSARARLDDATGNTLCQGCHSLMNPLGYPFEIYNHAGYLRVHDHAADGSLGPPNGSSTLSGLPDPALNGPVRDAVEFSEKLAQSPWVKRCFIRQAFRYYMGRDENLTDACTLSKMEQAYDSSGGSFFKMVGALIKSDTWTSRRIPGEGE